MSTPHRTPPQWIEQIVSALLPPSRREQVLGDLEERFVHTLLQEPPRHTHPRFTHDPIEQSFIEIHETILSMWDSMRPVRAQLQYARDAMQLVPSIAWRHLWRRHRTQQLQAVGAAPVSVDTLRQQAEELQDRIWRHHLLTGFGLGVMVMEIPILTMAFGFAGLITAVLPASYYGQWRKQGEGCPIPSRISLSDLIALHRESLKNHAENIGLPFGPVAFQLIWIARMKIFNPTLSGADMYLGIYPSVWKYGVLAAAVAFGGMVWAGMARLRLQVQIEALSAASNKLNK